MDSGTISQYLKLKPTTSTTLLDTSLCKIVRPTELQLVFPPNKRRSFRFSRIFLPKESHESLNSEMSTPLVRQVLGGLNACTIVLGSPSSGKTTVLYGNRDFEGITQSSLSVLYKRVSQIKETSSVVIMLSFVEIYNEAVRDLGLAYSNKDNLHQVTSTFKNQNLEVKDSNGRSYIENVEHIQCETVSEAQNVIRLGLKLQEMAGRPSQSHTVLSVSVSQKPFKSKNTSSSRLVFLDLSGADFLQYSAEPNSKIDLVSIKNMISKINLVYHNAPFVKVPFRASKLTHLLQTVFVGKTSLHLIATIDIDSSKYDDTCTTLKYCKGLMEVDKKEKVKVKVDESFDMIARLEEEIEELRDNINKSQEHHKRRLRYLAKLIGFDEDLEYMLNADRGSAIDINAKRYREAKSTVAMLEARMKNLKEKLATNKNILEEIKLVNTNNQQKNERELIELEREIKNSKEELINLRDEKNRFENHDTQDLEKLLFRSHIVLEDKSAAIQGLMIKMHEKSRLMKGQNEDREIAKIETSEKLRKRVIRQEAEFREMSNNLDQQFSFIIQEKDKGIRNLSYAHARKGHELNSKFEKTRKELQNLFEIATVQAQVIREIKSGAYNNNIVPIIMTNKEMQLLTALERFPLAKKAYKEKSSNLKLFKTLSSSRSMQNVTLETPKTLKLKSFDSFSTPIAEHKNQEALQNDIRNMQSQIKGLDEKVRTCSMEDIQKSVEKARIEKNNWEHKYKDLVKQRIYANNNQFNSEKLLKTGGRDLKDYLNYKNSKMPIVPKSYRKRIGTSRPGDRITARIK